MASGKFTSNRMTGSREPTQQLAQSSSAGSLGRVRSPQAAQAASSFMAPTASSSSPQRSTSRKAGGPIGAKLARAPSGRMLASRTAGNTILPEDASPVARNLIWQEHVVKELKKQVLRFDFTTNPKTMYLLPEKPQSMSMHAHIRALSQHAAAEEKAEAKRAAPTHHEAAVIRTIDAYRAVPKAKYAFPVTTNQDYGWDHPEQPNDREEYENRPLTRSDVSAYADAYLSSQGTNPFVAHHSRR